MSEVKTIKQMLNDREAAHRLNLSVQTLRNMRHERRGPTYYKMGRIVRYEISELELYIQAGRREEANTARTG